MNTAQLWRTLDSLYPMPISRTRNRIMRYLNDAVEMGMITKEERDILAADDAAWRERMMEQSA